MFKLIDYAISHARLTIASLIFVRGRGDRIGASASAASWATDTSRWNRSRSVRGSSICWNHSGGPRRRGSTRLPAPVNEAPKLLPGYGVGSVGHRAQSEPGILEQLPGVGRVRARKLMERLDISDSRRMRGLGEKQKKNLLEEFARR